MLTLYENMFSARIIQDTPHQCIHSKWDTPFHCQIWVNYVFWVRLATLTDGAVDGYGVKIHCTALYNVMTSAFRIRFFFGKKTQECCLTACFSTKCCAEEIKWRQGQWETTGAVINILFMQKKAFTALIILFIAAAAAAAAATLCKSEQQTNQSSRGLWLMLSFELDNNDGQQLSLRLRRQKANSRQLNKDMEDQ